MNKQKQRPPPMNPLITPSASPAPRSTPSALTSQTSDGPSPSKRSRLTATLSRSTGLKPPVISFSDQTYHLDNGGDLHNARRASSSRVLSIWSQLAERYSRPLAEDDIVDLRTGDIVKDRNVLRSDPGQYDIGCFGDANSNGDRSGTPTDEGCEGDSDDELDAFAPGADISDELELERVNREGVLPVREMDPADAEDLREFLEAENRRKDEFGTEGEVESVEDELDMELIGDAFTDASTDEIRDEMTDGEQWLTDPSPQPEPDPDEKGSFCSDIERTPLDDDKSIGSLSGSDDELAAWDEQDEGSTIYAIAGDLDSDDADGVIELPCPPEPPVFLLDAPRRRGQPRKSTDQSPHTSHSKAKHKVQLKRDLSPVQLHTPPQSSSSTTANTPDIGVSPAIPSSPPTPLRTKPKATPTTKARLHSKSALDTTIIISSKKSTSVPKTTTKAEDRTNPAKSKRKWEPEVVITERAHSSSTSSCSTPQKKTKPGKKAVPESKVEVAGTSEDDLPASRDSTKAANKAKRKGKKKTPISPNSKVLSSGPDSQSDDPITLDSPELHGRSLVQNSSSSERFSTPPPKPSSRIRKRKRVLSVSLSTEPRIDERGDTGVQLPPVSPDIDLIDFSSHQHGVGAQHQTSPVPKSKHREKSKTMYYRNDSHAESSSPLSIPKRSSSRAPKVFNTTANTQHYPYSESDLTEHHYYSEHDQNDNRNNSAPSMPPPPYHLPAMQAPQAQFLLAQAMQHLSYIMTASGHHQSNSNPGLPAWPYQSAAGLGHPPQSFVSSPYNSGESDQVLYTTPTHHRHYRHSSQGFDLPPVASSSASMYTTPAHTRQNPHEINPSFSGATLPPSSPDLSPQRSSSLSNGRSKSLTRARSKSNGRRVSFRIDDDRPHGFNDHERTQLNPTDSSLDDWGPLELSSPSKHSPITLSKRGRSKSTQLESSHSPAIEPMTRSVGLKGKEKANVDVEHNSKSKGLTSHSRTETLVGRRFERGQTPGPPSAAPPARSQSILKHVKRA